MFDGLPTPPDWTEKARCRSEAPEAWDTDNLPPANSQGDTKSPRAQYAHRICHPCPVWRECGLEALQLDTRGVIRAGIAFPDRGTDNARKKLQHKLGITPTSAHNRDKTVCGRGHELAGANVRIRSDGSRLCRECERIRKREKAMIIVEKRPVVEPDVSELCVVSTDWTHCGSGHVLNESTVLVLRTGVRVCVACQDETALAAEVAA